MAQGREAAAKDVKTSTPQVAVSFRMEGGRNKDCCRDCLYQVLIDFDAKGPDDRLPADELERVKTFMRTSYHARMGYESISGLGYHMVVPFYLPEGIVIDMAADAKHAEELYAGITTVRMDVENGDIYDLLGRTIAHSGSSHTDPLTFTLPRSGIYIVRIGNEKPVKLILP
jgi:hypothetical protein